MHLLLLETVQQTRMRARIVCPVRPFTVAPPQAASEYVDPHKDEKKNRILSVQNVLPHSHTQHSCASIMLCCTHTHNIHIHTQHSTYTKSVVTVTRDA